MDRVLDVPASERWVPAGKSAGVYPGRRIGSSFEDEATGSASRKTSKLQFNGDRTVNRHRWVS